MPVVFAETNLRRTVSQHARFGREQPAFGPGHTIIGAHLCDDFAESCDLMRLHGGWFGLPLARFGQFTAARMVHYNVRHA